VGRINARTRANTLNLIVDDGTGAIEVRKWVTEGDESDESPELQEGVYVKIYGNYKTYSNSHYISLLSAKLVESPDEITYHMLHAIHSHLHLSNGLPVIYYYD
jgi:replication factor A2